MIEQAAATSIHPARQLLHFLRDALLNAVAMVAVFLLLPGERLLRQSPPLLLVAMVTGFALMCAAQLLWFSGGYTVEWHSVPEVIATIALASFFGAILSRRTGHTGRGPVLVLLWWFNLALATLLMSALARWQDRQGEPQLAVLAWMKLQLAAIDSYTLWYGALAWAAVATGLALARSVRGAGHWRWPTALAMTAALALFATAYPLTLLREQDTPPIASGPPPSAPADEAVIYRQTELLEQQLAALAPQRPGIVDLYFIGVAGDAGEPVFQREIQHAATLMQQRFDTRGRSLLLVNHEATRTRLPIASVSALRRVLRHVGQLTDPAEDIVFIYLTSHGSREHQLVLDYAPLPLDWLDAGTLRTLMDEAGLGYRAVVVSACYSGGFIAPLRDERALVMTAADADSPSFGCGADTHYTWFGEALFKGALTATRSLEQGYRVAQTQIRQWEKRDGYAASDPQLAAGRAFLRQWQILQQRLEHGAGPASAGAGPARPLSSTCTARCDGR